MWVLRCYGKAICWKTHHKVWLGFITSSPAHCHLRQHHQHGPDHIPVLTGGVNVIYINIKQTEPRVTLCLPPDRWRRDECLRAQRSAPPSEDPDWELSLDPEKKKHHRKQQECYNRGKKQASLLPVCKSNSLYLAKLLCKWAGKKRVENDDGFIQIPQEDALRKERVCYHVCCNRLLPNPLCSSNDSSLCSPF